MLDLHKISLFAFPFFARFICFHVLSIFLPLVIWHLSATITNHINEGDLSLKPGWVRMSIHPTMSNEEVIYIMDAIEAVSTNHFNWAKEYNYNNSSNDFSHQTMLCRENNKKLAKSWFKL